MKSISIVALALSGTALLVSAAGLTLSIIGVAKSGR